jgi:hypothetical protein
MLPAVPSYTEQTNYDRSERKFGVPTQDTETEPQIAKYRVEDGQTSDRAMGLKQLCAPSEVELPLSARLLR